MVFATSFRGDAFVDIQISDNRFLNEEPMGTGVLVGGGSRVLISGNHVRNTEK